MKVSIKMMINRRKKLTCFTKNVFPVYGAPTIRSDLPESSSS